MRHIRAFWLAEGVVPLDLPQYAAVADDTGLDADTIADIMEWDLGPSLGNAESTLMYLPYPDGFAIACEKGMQ